MSAKRLYSCQQGTAAIEFALIAPVFFLLTIGGFNVAWSLHSIQTVHYAMSKAARVLELHPTTSESDLLEVMRSDLKINDRDKVTLTLEIEPADAGAKLAHANVEYPLAIWIPMIGTYSITLNTSITVPLAVL